MHGPGTDTELLDLRRALRDLVAISMLPGAWSGTTPDAVAYSLAQVLLRTLDLEFVYMQLQRPGVSAPLGTVATRATPTDATKAAQVADALVPLLESAPCGSVPAIPNPLGSGTVQLIASPIGFDARSGVVVAASPRSDFPTEQERTILTVAVNQAFSVLESKWAIETREQIVRREQDARGEAETAQARYRDLVNSLDAIVWEADAKTLRFSFVSRRAEDVLGYPVERWLTEPHFWAEHLHPDDRAWAVDFCVQCIAAKENHQFEYRILAADGRIVWLRNILNVVLDEASEPTLLRGVMLDITRQKQAEDARARLAAIVESSEDAIASKDLNGILTSWNRGAERLFGYTAAEAIGQPVTMLIPDERADEEQGILARIRSGERIEHYETVRRCKDGTLLDISLTVSPIVDTQGRIVGASKIARDITERKRAEQALIEQTRTVETINRVSRDLAAELNLEKLVQAVTDAATALAGAEFAAFFFNVVSEHGESYQLYTLSGAPKEAFSQFPVPRNTAVFAPTFRGEGVVRLADVTQDRRYGQSAPYHGMPPGHLPVRSYLAVPVVSRSGEVLGGLILGHSRAGVFTERAEQLVVGIAAQAAIAIDNARLYEDAERAVHVRDDFLATVSHDLKNPLGALKGTAQLLQRRLRRTSLPEAEFVIEGLGRIDETATRMARMINTLLDITRVQMGQSLPLDRQPTDLVALAREVARDFQEATEQHRLQVQTTVAALIGHWDRDRLERVLGNLLSNAIKYSPEGGTVTISLAQEMRAAEAWAVLTVQDHGVGIPVADLPRLFERFQRGRNVQDLITGTGLGLVAARQIVEQHNGTIAVASQEGVGTSVTVRLPLGLDPPSDPPESP
jgi:PAS domain S-box-containing protein